MFITVKYGDNRSQIFNPDCLNMVLLHNIKERCQCDEEDVVDLSDETGAVKHLHTNLTDYGTEYFTDREHLILLRVERLNEETKPVYKPLLTGMEDDKEFISKLNPKKSSRRKRGGVGVGGGGGSENTRKSSKQKLSRRGSIHRMPPTPT